MKRWILRFWLASTLLAIAGCGSYEPSSTPADAQLQYDASSKASLADMQKLLDILTEIKDDASADNARNTGPQAMNALKLDFASALGAKYFLTPDKIAAVDASYFDSMTKAGQNLTQEFARLAKKPGSQAELAKSLKEPYDEMLKSTTAAPTAVHDADAPSWGGWLLDGILVLLFGACMGFLFTEGLWNNALRLVNVVFSALLAMNFFEPAARWMTSNMPSYTAMFDFLAIWGIFAISMIVMREITDRVSRVRVRFLSIVDKVGGIAIAAWIGWIMVCFTLTTLHTAPLGRNFLFGAFRPGEKMFLGMLAPDSEWLGFTQNQSAGSLSDSPNSTFDPHCQFIATQTERRTQFQGYVGGTSTEEHSGYFLINPDLANSNARVK